MANPLQITVALVVVSVMVYLQWFKPAVIKNNRGIFLAALMVILFLGNRDSLSPARIIMIGTLAAGLIIYEIFRHGKAKADSPQ